MSIWKKMRLEAGISQTEMANKMNISNSSLSLFESGKKKMPVKYWLYYFELNKIEHEKIISFLKEMGY